MRSTFCLMLILGFFTYGNLSAQNEIFKFIEDILQDPGLFEINQEPGHAPLLSYSLEEEKFIPETLTETGYMSLNGMWSFLWNAAPGLEPEGFYNKDFNTSEWDRIKVPSNWQMEGYGYPKFRNISHPFPSDPPYVPMEDNPVGTYKRNFVVPDEWKDRQVLLHFEGVHSASILWVNGEEVGYNQGGMEQAEYDITEYLVEGVNNVTVNVYRWSDGSYLEDQDMWRLSGIFRDVYILALPKASIRDYYITTSFDDDYEDAVLSAMVKTINTAEENTGILHLRAQLFNVEGNRIISEGDITSFSLHGNEIKDHILEFAVQDPARWSSETPNLYILELLLMQGKDKILQRLKIPVGFRSVEYNDRALMINGRQVKLNAVNSHMQHPELGHAMDIETIRKDFILMKSFNINCVRTSHYPPEPEYVYMADKYGIYIVNETGDEAHSTTYLSELPEWRDAYIERVEKLVLRDRSHPSVIIWSAGNESGSGDNICAVINRGLELDPSRPRWMYGGNADYFPRKDYLPCEGIIGPRYPKPHELKYYVAYDSSEQAFQSSFMDEYLAATGNGLGGLDEYWEVIRKHRRTIGGAVWDWISPAITARHQKLVDHSGYDNIVDLQGKGEIREGKFGKALKLSGHDSWVEVYRDKALDITGKELSIDLWIKPGRWNGAEYIVSKGMYQFGFRYPSSTSLSFYAGGEVPGEAASALPDDWQGNWHHIAGTYDGKMLRLYIDGKLAAETPYDDNIINRPYPVCIGWTTDINGMEYSGYTGNASYDRFRIFNRAVDIKNLYSGGESIPEPLLHLDFEEVIEGDKYYSLGIGARSYGTIWPDREIQPEMWQLKKSPQPIVFSRELSSSIYEFTILNGMSFISLDDLNFNWELLQDGAAVVKKDFNPDALPGERELIPLDLDEYMTENAEYTLTLSAKLKEDVFPLKKGHEIAWEQFLIKEKKEEIIQNWAQLSPPVVSRDDEKIVIEGDNFKYELKNEAGEGLSLVYEELKIDLKGPFPNIWRAPVANELDSWTTYRGGMEIETPGMGNDIANAWRSLGIDELRHEFGLWKIGSATGRSAVIETEFLSFGKDEMTSFESRYKLEFFPDGSIDMFVTLIPNDRMTEWLPKVGIQLEIPAEYKNLEWYGRGPYETYPDRKTGAKVGIWNSTAEKEFQPYIIPQDYGNHTDTRWIKLSDSEGEGLIIEGNDVFHFSLHQYSTDNLTRAKYPFQLKQYPNLILNLDHKVSGVGGNAIGLMNQYKVYPEKYKWGFRIKPVK